MTNGSTEFFRYSGMLSAIFSHLFSPDSDSLCEILWFSFLLRFDIFYYYIIKKEKVNEIPNFSRFHYFYD